MAYTYTPNDNFYDIESLNNVFTYTQYNPVNHRIDVFPLVGEEIFVSLEKLFQAPIDQIKTKIKQKMVQVNPELHNAKIVIHSGIDKLMTETIIPAIYHFLPYSIQTEISNRESIKPLPKTEQSYQFGFNSKNYDTAMVAYLVSLWIERYTPNALTNGTGNRPIKDMSNRIIQANYPGQAWDYKSSTALIYKAMTKSKHFVDVRLLLGKSAALTLSLKRYAAQAGWQILESELVKGSHSLHTINEFADLLAYNALDVLHTKRLFEEKDWQTGFDQHRQLLERFKNEFNDKLSVDTTNTKFIEYVIVPDNNGNPQKLVDSKTIDLTFPTASGNKDLLEIAHKLGLPDEAYYFYDNYRNAPDVEEGKRNVLKDPRLEQARQLDIISKTGTTLDLWISNGNGTYNNSHINFSIGGAHGEYADRQEFEGKQDYLNRFITEQQKIINIYETADDEHKKLIYQSYKNKETLSDNFTIPTNILVSVKSKKQEITAKKQPVFKAKPSEYGKVVCAKNVIHADVDSLYPSLLTLLKTLVRLDGNDVYGELRNERLKLKLKLKLKSLPEDDASWTDHDREVNRIQLLNKLLLNSATGGADANFDTNILVSNKITAMRIIGNLLIAILSYALAAAGGTLVSINTDGLYVYGISEDKADKIINNWTKQFNLSAKPEIVEKFISKDANNRLEIGSGNKLQYAGGSSFSAWKKPSMTKSVAKPAIMDETLVKYLWSQKEPLDNLDKSKIKQYLIFKIKSSNTIDEKTKTLLQFQWLFTGQRSKNRYYFAETKEHQFIEQSNNIRTFLVDPNKTNKAVKIRLLAVNKTNATNHPETRKIIQDNKISLQMEPNQHFITPTEETIESLINNLKQIKFTKKQTELEIDWIQKHQKTLKYLIEYFNLTSSVSLFASFKEIKDNIIASYDSEFRGKDSVIIRGDFVASPRVADDMSFIVDNRDLRTIASTTNLLDILDLDAYVSLIANDWAVWSNRHENLMD